MSNKTGSRRLYIKDLTSKTEFPSIRDFLNENHDTLKFKNVADLLVDSKMKPKVTVDLTPSPPPTFKDYFSPSNPPLGRAPAKKRSGVSDSAPNGVLEADQFLTLDEVIENIKSDSNPDAPIAIAVTGGGARGPYEAGVIEAIFQKFHKAQLKPSIVAGTSAGSICATCTYADLLYPRSLPPTNDIFFTRQAMVWRDVVGAGNNGSQTLFKDKAWIIEYATGKKALPGVELFFDTVANIDQTWKDLGTDVTNLAKTGKDLVHAITSMDGTALAAKIKIVTDTIGSDKASIQRKFDDLTKALNDFDVNPFDGDTPVGDAEDIISAAWELLAALGSFLADLANGAFQIGVGAVQSLISYFENIGQKLGEFAKALAHIVGDAGTLIGNALLLGGLIAALVALVTAIIAYASEIIIGVLLFFGGRAILSKTGLIDTSKPFDHVLPNDGIMGLLSKFIDDAASEFAGPNGPKQKPLERWMNMAAAERPEIFLTGTNLNAARSMVFAMASKEKLAAMAADDTWVFDMLGQLDVTTPLVSSTLDLEKGFITDSDGKDKAVTSKYFRSASMKTQETLVKATMTSSTIPCAFEPQKWNAIRRRPSDLNQTQSIAQHAFVDGGLIDNSPVDLAVYAGAKHIISIELGPLTRYNDNEDFNLSPEYDLVSLIGASFNASMTGSLQKSLSYIGNANESREDDDPKKLNIYRIAPLIPDSVTVMRNGEPKKVAVSPGTITFDGVYNDKHHLVMNLYDWFIQGYVDAMGYTANDKLEDLMAKDPIIADYMANGATRKCAMNAIPLNNQFWYMTERPIPESKDYADAKITPPTAEMLATRAEKS